VRALSKCKIHTRHGCHVLRSPKSACAENIREGFCVLSLGDNPFLTRQESDPIVRAHQQDMSRYQTNETLPSKLPLGLACGLALLGLPLARALPCSAPPAALPLQRAPCRAPSQRFPSHGLYSFSSTSVVPAAPKVYLHRLSPSMSPVRVHFGDRLTSSLSSSSPSLPANAFSATPRALAP
jgi:hypothetical protein